MFRKRAPDNADEWLREWAALELRWVGDSRPGGVLPNDERPAQSRLWERDRSQLVAVSETEGASCCAKQLDQSTRPSPDHNADANRTCVGLLVQPHGVLLVSLLM